MPPVMEKNTKKNPGADTTDPVFKTLNFFDYREKTQFLEISPDNRTDSE
jgi:hypothetical protein